MVREHDIDPKTIDLKDLTSINSGDKKVVSKEEANIVLNNNASSGDTEALADKVAKQLIEMKNLMEKLDKSLQAEKAHSAKLETDGDKLKSENHRLTDKIKELEKRPKQDELDDLRKKSEDVQAECEQKGKKIEDLEKGNADHVKEIASLKEEMRVLKGFKSKWTDKIVDFGYAMEGYKLLSGIPVKVADPDGEGDVPHDEIFEDIQKKIEEYKLPELRQKEAELKDVKLKLKNGGFIDDVDAQLSTNKTAELSELVDDALKLKAKADELTITPFLNLGVRAAQAAEHEKTLLEKNSLIEELKTERDKVAPLEAETKRLKTDNEKKDVEVQAAEAEKKAAEFLTKLADKSKDQWETEAKEAQRELDEVRKSCYVMEHRLNDFEIKTKAIIAQVVVPPPEPDAPEVDAPLTGRQEKERLPSIAHLSTSDVTISPSDRFKRDKFSGKDGNLSGVVGGGKGKARLKASDLGAR